MAKPVPPINPPKDTKPRDSQSELVEAVKAQTEAIDKLVGIVAALLAHIEGEQEVGEDRPAATYMDGTPKQ